MLSNFRANDSHKLQEYQNIKPFLHGCHRSSLIRLMKELGKYLENCSKAPGTEFSFVLEIAIVIGCETIAVFRHSGQGTSSLPVGET